MAVFISTCIFTQGFICSPTFPYFVQSYFGRQYFSLFCVFLVASTTVFSHISLPFYISWKFFATSYRFLHICVCLLTDFQEKFVYIRQNFSSFLFHCLKLEVVFSDAFSPLSSVKTGNPVQVTSMQKTVSCISIGTLEIEVKSSCSCREPGFLDCWKPHDSSELS